MKNDVRIRIEQRPKRLEEAVFERDGEKKVGRFDRTRPAAERPLLAVWDFC